MFRVIVIGLGVQGYKRRKFAGEDFVASVDPVNPEADYKNLEDIDPETYDAALCCTPDGAKVGLLRYLLARHKHALVEKPLWAPDEGTLRDLEQLARDNQSVLYTAYNHRFEPHFMRVKDYLSDGQLGEIYRCRLFYGNGTARLVRESAWRDQGSGVLHDLGSHLLDTALYWFGDIKDPFRIISCDRFENVAPDHVVVGTTRSKPELEFEMTLVSWRNHFTCDIFAEKGSIHIESLCKWGPSRFIERKRVLPSGRPVEKEITLVQEDPTWESEYAHFKKLCKERARSNLSRDIWVNETLRNLGAATKGEEA